MAWPWLPPSASPPGAPPVWPFKATDVPGAVASADDALPGPRLAPREPIDEEHRPPRAWLPDPGSVAVTADALPARARREESQPEEHFARRTAFLPAALDPGIVAFRRAIPAEPLPEERSRRRLFLPTDNGIAWRRPARAADEQPEERARRRAAFLGIPAASVLLWRVRARPEEWTAEERRGVPSLRRFVGIVIPVYVDAPFERYVWAPPDVRTFEVAPGDPPLTANPTPSLLVADAQSSTFVVASADSFVVPPEYRTFVGGSPREDAWAPP